MELKQFYFPVEEKEVFMRRSSGDFKVIPHKLIYRPDTHLPIAVHTDRYKLIRNEDLIKETLEQIEKTDVRYIINEKESFVTSRKMRLKLDFPELTIAEENVKVNSHTQNSQLNLSLYIHNSYDGSEGNRGFWGYIRSICTNGAISGTLLGKYFHKHTSGISVNSFKLEFEKVYDRFPLIKERIRVLQQLDANAEDVESTAEEFHNKELKEWLLKPEVLTRITNQWMLYNALTRFVTHNLKAQQQFAYQQVISKQFKL